MRAFHAVLLSACLALSSLRPALAQRVLTPAPGASVPTVRVQSREAQPALDSLNLLQEGLAQTAAAPARSEPVSQRLDRFYAGSKKGAAPAVAAPPSLGGAPALSASSRVPGALARAVPLATGLFALEHPGASLAAVAALAAGYLGLRRLWAKSTVFKIIVTAPLIVLTLPLGRLEVLLRSRRLLKEYPGAKTLGGGHSNVVLLAKRKDGRRVVIKQYGATGTFLATLSRLILPVRNPAGIGRRDRFETDRSAYEDFKAAGIPASLVLSSDPKRLINVNSFVEGKPLVSLIDDEAAVRESGRSLRLAHDRGWAIIDNQPSNFVIGPSRRAYFIDLEHAHRDPQGAYRGWDIGIYLTWLACSAPGPRAAKIEKAFWDGYGEASQELRERAARVRRQMRAFAPFMKVSSHDSATASR